MGLGTLSLASLILVPSPPQKSTTFIGKVPQKQTAGVRIPSCRFPSRTYRCFGNRNDEFASPLADMSHLLHDLVLQVPGQGQQVVRSSLADLVGGIDRNVSPRSKLPMLVGIPIHRIVKKICPHSTIVQQRIALARGSV